MSAPPSDRRPLPLAGVKVVDAATIFAGPVAATLLGDYGADVIRAEHPDGDSLRGLGWHRDGVSLWWAHANRNKRGVTIKLSHSRGRDLMLALLADADVLIENFRPGTLDRWGLDWETLHESNPRLVVARVTGFGQTGPYRNRPGFGTLAESMSGFAHINGHPDGPPTLPPFALADGIAALSAAFSIQTALYWRDTGGGIGQEIDLSIYEPLFWILGPQSTVYDQLGLVQQRTGNRAPFTAPRNVFITRDGTWLGLSASAQSIAERTMRLVGRVDLVAEPWFADHTGRLEHQDELDAAIGAWIGERDTPDVIVANLPYIPRSAISKLPAEVRLFEPHTALDGGPDGLQLVMQLVDVASHRLAAGGYLIVELGLGQTVSLSEYLEARPELQIVATHYDLQGIPRVMTIRRPLAGSGRPENVDGSIPQHH